MNLTAYELLQQFRQHASTLIDDYERKTGRGSAKSYEEYREHVGYARGMAAMMAEFNDLAKTLITEDVEDF